MNGGVDDDPLNDKCDACGAEVAEPCRVGCIGKAAHEDALAERSDVHGADGVIRSDRTTTQ